MDSSVKLSLSLQFHSTLLVLVSFISLIPSNYSSLTDYSTLVYKNCANQTFTGSNTDSYTQTLASLFQQFIGHSSQAKFFRTIDGGDKSALSGLYQCRGDISNDDCHNCVTGLPQMSNSLCKGAMAARVQTQGCYVTYQADGIQESSNNDLIYKICGDTGGIAAGFQEVRDAAFQALEEGIASSNDGFYSTTHDSVEVMAQCEGDLEGCDCGDCVSNAVQIAQEECGFTSSAQVYLDRCYISYTCSPDGTPGNFFPDNGGDGNEFESSGKAMAIALGAAAAVGAAVVLYAFLRSKGKKDDDR